MHWTFWQSVVQDKVATDHNLNATKKPCFLVAEPDFFKEIQDANPELPEILCWHPEFL